MRITIPYDPEPREVEALPTPTPGLCVHAELDRKDRWVVTHIRSGAAVAKCPDPELALDVAIKLGAVADWTRPGLDLCHDPAVVRGRRAVLRNARIQSYQDGPTVPESTLRTLEGAA